MGYFEKANDFQSFKQLVRLFLESEEFGLDPFISPEMDTDKAYQNIMKYMGYLIASLQQLNADSVSDITFVNQLRVLNKDIKVLLEKID